MPQAAYPYYKRNFSVLSSDAIKKIRGFDVKPFETLERLTVNQDVTGSSPVTGAKTDKSEP